MFTYIPKFDTKLRDLRRFDSKEYSLLHERDDSTVLTHQRPALTDE